MSCIPVCLVSSWPDLQNVIHHSGLSEEELIKRHSSVIIFICLGLLLDFSNSAGG